MRRKNLTYDGETYVISPLTLEQVEEFIKPLADGNLEKTSPAELTKRARQLVAYGLENARRNAEDANPWTEQRVFKEIDLRTFGDLQREILDFSDLKREEGDESGESLAATAKA